MTRSIDPRELSRAASLDDLVRLLGDDLDWPVGHFELDDVTFDWTAEDLGLASGSVPSLVGLRQLRPLVTGQPWGVFLVEFGGDRLPLGQMRRMLERLVERKRAKGDGTLNTWKLSDLLFLVASGRSDTLEMHLVAFGGEGATTAEFRSVAWRPVQSPSQHLRRLATELLPKLAWPDGDETLDQWSSRWRTAFDLRPGEAISSASRLASRMAEVAQRLRSQISEALDQEGGGGPFSEMLDEVRTQLVADVDEAKFADMSAQTLVYGLLASRVTDPESFGASPVLSAIPLANPFLAALFERVQDQASVLDLDGTGLEALVADLRETRVEAILDQFGSTARGGDPVIHFYEEFLKVYDRRLRADAGAFYTPQPLVEFIVRSVDQILRERFGLREGVASGDTWGEVAARSGFDVPDQVDSASRFVSMIDPATGTGTFLVEWLKRARQSYVAVHGDTGWPDHLRAVVIPSMHAFELMLGPYAIAHLKLAIELSHDGIDMPDLNILLTDTLDYSDHDALTLPDDAVADEGARASELKANGHFTVVVGNPPYNREQHESASHGERRKGGIARYGVQGVPPLMSSALEPLKAAGLGRYAVNAYNDYVYFWVWGIWQVLSRKKSPGVVAFITASSFLDGVSFGGLRSHMRDAFDELLIVDLGGEGRGAVVDENVFDIQTPVSIAIGIATRDSKSRSTVQYARVTGTREEKLRALAELQILELNADEVRGQGVDTFVPREAADYWLWPSLEQVFPWRHAGSKVHRSWPIAEAPNVLERRWDRFLRAEVDKKPELLKETRDRKVSQSAENLLGGSRLPALDSLPEDATSEPIVRYGYRSFDRQWIIADSRLADLGRPELWRALGPNQIYFTTLTSTPLGQGPVLIATPDLPDFDHFSGRGAKNVMPLYRDPKGAIPNMSSEFTRILSLRLGQDVDALAVAAYVYGLTSTPAFFAHFGEILSRNPAVIRVPFTADGELFVRVSGLGRILLSLHTWGERIDGPVLTSGQIDQFVVTEPAAYPESFTWDSKSESVAFGDGLVMGVSEDIWAFSVSGLQVVKSWFGYRMKKRSGRSSSQLDQIRPEVWAFTDELRLMLATIKETLRLEPVSAGLLEEVLDGSLILSDELPKPSEEETKPPGR